MTPDAIIRILLSVLIGVCLGYATGITRKARRTLKEASAFRDACEAKLTEVSALLVHMMRDHTFMHEHFHTHDDEEKPPTVQ